MVSIVNETQSQEGYSNANETQSQFHFSNGNSKFRTGKDGGA